MSKLDMYGSEVPDQTPVAIPAYIKKWDQRDSIREMIREALSREAEEAGYESFEEADDFDVGDDYDPSSPYEEEFDPQGNSLWDRDYDQGGDVGSGLSDPEAPAAGGYGASGPDDSPAGAAAGGAQ